MTETLNYKPLTNCLCCDSTNLTIVLDLQTQPLANSYLQSKDEVEESFPLALNYCNDCTHLQLTHVVNPDLLFKHYLYVSGTTTTLKNYFNYFARLAASYLVKDKLNVLDIACNDGSQLDSFKKLGHNTYGVDPAKNLYELSSKNHKIVCDYFTEESVKDFPLFDVITAQNVFAHNSYPLEFLEVCKKHLSDDGRIFIQTSQANMVELGQFDTIYHEHMSFFNINSMVTLVKRAGLYLSDVFKTEIHGTSYVFVLSKKSTDDKSNVLLLEEKRKDLLVVEKFSAMAKQIVTDLKNELKKYPESLIVGYGAAAKGNTLLNFGKIDLDYIVDDNPLKQNLFTPGRKIKIVSIDEVKKLAGTKKIVWVPLSWNFFNEIMSRVKEKYSNGTFIKYFPKIEVVES